MNTNSSLNLLIEYCIKIRKAFLPHTTNQKIALIDSKIILLKINKLHFSPYLKIFLNKYLLNIVDFYIFALTDIKRQTTL